ncbi:hypothetical protein WJX73_000287 [Symbiochloris irregularis]|uniref:DNA-directed RNA polymerase III subunit RPC8 n=1 Tax=Symbiochloris irregularis TaxID=706552 RepID=A0AAW1PFN4_9CHLO
MFRLVAVQENVRIKPADLGRPLVEAVLAELDESYLDKVIADVGLVVATYDVQEITGGILHHSEGAPHYEVKFRLLIFRPQETELLKGKLIQSDEHGVYISLGFFSDVMIPFEYMQTGTIYNQKDNIWCWQAKDANLQLDMGEEVLFRVQDVTFHKQPTLAEFKAANPGADEQDFKKQPPVPPMVINGSFNDAGLGLVQWWSEEEAEQDE